MTPKELKRIRKKTGLSQPKFAEKFDLSPAMITHWETGRFNISDEAAAKIRQAIEYQPDILVEPQTEAKDTLLGYGSVPITVRLPNGYEIVVKGTLKKVIKQLSRL